MIRNLKLKLIIGSLICSLCLSFILIFSSDPLILRVPQTCPSSKCPGDIESDDTKFSNRHKLGVIVPYRNRFNQLLQFVPHINQFLKRQQINHKIYIINQVDKYRFNRASLINVGFLQAYYNDGCDYISMHDVDLLPLNDQLNYGYPGVNKIFHVSSPDLHPKYHYKTFVGGVLIITSVDFESLNGMSNRYWGWGLEDDEFYARIKQKNLEIKRPIGIKTGINDTFLHIHDDSIRRDTAKLFNQREATRRRDRETGLHDVNYKLLNSREVIIEGSPCTILDIELQCDISMTPWCQYITKSAKNTTTGNSPKKLTEL